MVRPVDVQHIMGNLENVEKVQQMEQQQLQSGHHHFSEELAKKVEADHSKVKESPDGHGAVIHEKEEKNKERQTKKKRETPHEDSDQDEGDPVFKDEDDHIVNIVI